MTAINVLSSSCALVNNDVIISVIVPTYNRSYELSLFLESFAHEVDFVTDKVELLISSNNSVDDTTEIVTAFIEKYSDMISVRYFVQESNAGPISNLHYLIRQSKGVFSWGIGDDDLLAEGKLAYVVSFLKNYNKNLLLVRSSGVHEWDRIPERKHINNGLRILNIGINSQNNADYIFAAAFLGSVILRTETWLKVLSKTETFRDTSYSNWVAVLLVLSEFCDYSVIDNICVQGNINMTGEGRILYFNVLILGRLRIWKSLKSLSIRNLLKPKILKLVRNGWLVILLGEANDITTFNDKKGAAFKTICLLGKDAYKVLPYIFISFLVPVPFLFRFIKRCLPGTKHHNEK